MKPSLLSILFLVISTATWSANAVDMFIFDAPQVSNAIRTGDSQALGNIKQSFSAKINAAAMQQESIVVNLPHKSMPAKRMSVVGNPSEQITPYSFESQKGSVFVDSVNGELEAITVYDEQAKEVFKGERQADGSILFKQVDIHAYICDEFDHHTAEDTGFRTAEAVSNFQDLPNLTMQQVSSLQSRPGATNVLYIDYFAGSVSGTAWNTGEGAPAVINYENYSYDDDASSFSLIDRQSMYAGWAEAAEDYAPFNINVTTDLAVYNAASFRNKVKIISTSTNWRNSGGVAYVGVFGIRNDDFYNIGWTFNNSFGTMGMTNSHESGHQMGLSHDGEQNAEGVTTRTYYGGQGNSGPIMGGPFGNDFVHWSKGDYPNANEQQNDIEIIEGRLGVVADDHGDTNATSTPLISEQLTGFISPAGVGTNIDTDVDVDAFNFTLNSAQNVELTVRSLFEQFNSRPGCSRCDNTAGGLNLSAKIELKDASGTILQQKLPTNVAANNGFAFSGNLAAGTYYLTIQNQSYLTSEFSEYGNGGYYQILNNLSQSSTAADLRVVSASVDESSLAPGAAFVFSGSVQNQGNEAAAATTLTYYRSLDATIDTTDTEVGTDSVPALSPDSASPESIDLTAPTTNGDYYYGACVTTVTNEDNTDNNCSVGVLVTVAPPPVIDLVVQSPAVNDNTLTPGQAFTFSASVRNQGDTASGAGTLTYRLSTNNIITTRDANIGSDPVDALNAGATSAENTSLTAPTAAGTYYYGACISTSVETTTSNNCSAGVQVTVAPAPVIDLVLPAPAVSDSTLTPDQAFTLSVTVINQGNAASNAGTMTYYRSNDATISTGDTAVGSDPVGALAASASGLETISLNAPTATGTYYYGACVSVSGETVTNNNCSASVSVSVAPTPVVDLVVQSPAVNDSTLTPSQEFTFSASVRNQGNATSNIGTLTYYRSTNSTITTGDTVVGSESVGALTASASGIEAINLNAPTATGTYYYGACVSVSGEAVTNNNCSAAVSVSVAPAPVVDLVVQSPAVNDSTLTPSQEFTFSASVRNQGNATADIGTLTYYRSTDSTITTSDSVVGTDSLPPLLANAFSNESISLTAPTNPGDYYYGACASVSNETVTNNNCSTGIRVTVEEVVAADAFEPDNSPAAAKTISKGITQTHSIHTLDDEDWLTFSLPSEATNVVIETSGAGDNDTRIWLRDSDSIELASDLNGGNGNYSKISLETLPAGTYYLEIDEQGNNDLIDDYQVSLNYDLGVADEEEEDSLCIPIQTKNGKVTLICI